MDTDRTGLNRTGRRSSAVSSGMAAAGIFIPGIFLLLILTASGCYTQLHPPVVTGNQPPAAADSLAGQAAAVADTVYYPQPVYDPFAPYYYSRHSRWNNYYNTVPLWWYGYENRYYRRTYHHDVYVPPASVRTAPPAVQAPSNRRRKLQFDTAPAANSRPVQAQPAPAPAPAPAAANTEEDDDDDNSQPKQEPQSNRRRKLDF